MVAGTKAGQDRRWGEQGAVSLAPAGLPSLPPERLAQDPLDPRRVGVVERRQLG